MVASASASSEAVLRLATRARPASAVSALRQPAVGVCHRRPGLGDGIAARLVEGSGAATRAGASGDWPPER